jgi:hypothetical protein
MHFVEILLHTAEMDRTVLESNRSLGDKPEIPRDMDFALHAKDEQQAQTVCSFIVDNGYGKPSLERIDDPKLGTCWRITVIIHAPATENVVCCLSGMMVTVCACFGLEYVGWGSFAQTGGPAGTK